MSAISGYKIEQKRGIVGTCPKCGESMYLAWNTRTGSARNACPYCLYSSKIIGKIWDIIKKEEIPQ